MLVIAAVLGLATVAAPVVREARPAKVHPLFVASLALNAADFATRPPAALELNPIVRPLIDKPVALAALKLGSALIPELIARRMDKGGHHTPAKVVRCLSLTVPAVGLASNVRSKAKRGDWNVSLRLSF